MQMKTCKKRLKLKIDYGKICFEDCEYRKCLGLLRFREEISNQYYHRQRWLFQDCVKISLQESLVGGTFAWIDGKGLKLGKAIRLQTLGSGMRNIICQVLSNWKDVDSIFVKPLNCGIY